MNGTLGAAFESCENGTVVGVKYPFGPTSSPQYSFSRFLLIQLGDVIPAWHRYPDLKPLAHLLKALKLKPLY
jgi:hypothetical protein